MVLTSLGINFQRRNTDIFKQPKSNQLQLLSILRLTLNNLTSIVLLTLSPWPNPDITREV